MLVQHLKRTDAVDAVNGGKQIVRVFKIGLIDVAEEPGRLCSNHAGGYAMKHKLQKIKEESQELCTEISSDLRISKGHLEQIGDEYHRVFRRT